MLLQKSRVLKQSEFCADYINLTRVLTSNILKGIIALLLDMLRYFWMDMPWYLSQLQNKHAFGHGNTMVLI